MTLTNKNNISANECFLITSGNCIEKNDTKQSEIIEMIEDLVIGASYSHSDIARKANLSPSEIRKISKGVRHEPRYRVYHALLKVYCGAFYGKNRTKHAEAFLKIKKHHPLEWLEELIFIDINKNYF